MAKVILLIEKNEGITFFNTDLTFVCKSRVFGGKVLNKS
jgi:hypothetical protein